MQHIGVHIQNDKGKPVEESEINFADVMKIVYEVADYKNKLPLLSTVDPYDDTLFNSLQIIQLIEELKELPSSNRVIEDSIVFLSKVGQSQYVEFYGD